MYYLVTNAIKKRFVSIFEEILSRHSIFEKVKVFTRFPQEERPKIAILVRSVSGGSQKLSLDNFVGIHRGYCTLANLKGVTGNSIEWVRDDQEHIDVMSPHGFYIVRITHHDIDSNNFNFVVDPYLVCDEEELEIVSIRSKEGAILKNKPINPNSEIVFSKSNQFELKKDIDYVINYDTGEILFLQPIEDNLPIVVDYQICMKQLGPFITEYYNFDNSAIPGVIIAFGDRIRVGDEQVVVVDKQQSPICKVFGGRWLLDVDVTCVAQDSDQQERLLDFVSTSLWANYQDSLANEGIVLRDFALPGESEDLEIEIPEEYNFSSSLSFSIETDWEIFVPLITELRRINYGYGEESFKRQIDNISEEKYENDQYDSRMYGSDHQKGLNIVPSLEPFSTQGFFPSTRKY